MKHFSEVYSSKLIHESYQFESYIFQKATTKQKRKEEIASFFKAVFAKVKKLSAKHLCIGFRGRNIWKGPE